MRQRKGQRKVVNREHVYVQSRRPLLTDQEKEYVLQVVSSLPECASMPTPRLRNIRVFREWLHGANTRKVAMKYKLSNSRVWQINRRILELVELEKTVTVFAACSLPPLQPNEHPI